MKWRLVDPGPPRKFLLVLRSGDEVFSSIKELAAEETLKAAAITGIGAFRECEIAFYDKASKGYVHTQLGEPLEVLSFTGNVTLNQGEPFIHAHVTVADANWSARGGHLISATVQPTLELVIAEWSAHPGRSHDPESGLALIDL